MSSNMSIKSVKKTAQKYSDMFYNYCDDNNIRPGTSLLVLFIAYACIPNFIVQVMRLIISLNIFASGIMLSSFIVSTCVYKKEDVDDFEDDSEEEEEEENYEDKYDIDEIEDISGNPSESIYISDNTPEGVVFMKYNNYSEGFEYWADKQVNYQFLETVCRKFVKIYRCKNMYVDRKRLFKEKKEKAEEMERNKEESKQMEKEDLKSADDDWEEDVFAKLKTNVDKNYESKKVKMEDVVEDANKFIYKGKLNEMMPFTVKRTDELSENVVKEKMSFSMFKALGLK